MLGTTQLRSSFFRTVSFAVLATACPILTGCASTASYSGGGSGCAAGGCATTGPADQQYVMGVNEGCDPQSFAGEGCGIDGCNLQGGGNSGCGGCDVPRELRKVSLHDYRIEPPDVLLIEAANNLRPANDPIGAGEVLILQANRTIPEGEDDTPIAKQFKTIDGPYVVGTDGYLNLGPEYGKVHCAGQPLAEIQRRVEIHLKRILTNPQVLVTLPDPSAKQAVAGQHLVRPDGTVGLGIYGGVYVAGMTLAEAKLAIERHLTQHMHNPQISVDVLGYNSKSYYVIADGGGAGNQVYKLPSTGNETVLDAIAQIKGLPTVSNSGKIWVARPNSDGCKADQLLFVDWEAISMGGDTCTNYQLFPGDRLYVQADGWIKFDTNLAKITAPFERLLGIAVLGNGTVRGFQQGSSAFGGGGGGL